jgi:cardiolipin synthase
MVSRELVAALTEARHRMATEAWQTLITELGATEGFPTAESIGAATASILNRDAACILSEVFGKHKSTPWLEIAAAMSTVDSLVGGKKPLAELIWTGPANNRFPVRRIDQVLYDLISESRTQIVLVTFAAHRVLHLCSHLTRAVERGVDLTLIVESEGESEGQLTRDARSAFENIPLTRTRIYYWPLEKRERNAAGRPGKLHVKCAIVDDVALIGSANLTDDAFNRNMELGILLRDHGIVFAIAEHFRELVCSGVLVEVRRTVC